MFGSVQALAARSPGIAAGAVVMLSLLLGFWAQRKFLAWLARLAETTPWAADVAVVSSLRRPLPIWIFIGGLYVASRIVGVPPEVARILERVVLLLLIVSTSFWAANLVPRLLQIGGDMTSEGVAAASATGVVRSLVRVAVLALGALALLGTLGISIAPFLTTMGLGGLAVALGLRETLANLFAGIQIMLARNVRVGDFVKLESGEEGWVEDIHWRATRVKTLLNNFVVIPNSKLAESIVTNYHLPGKDVLIVVPVGVHHASDLERVERITCEVAHGIMTSIPGGVPDFQPLVRYSGFADSSIDFNVILKVQEFKDDLLVRHEFIKALARRYATEGIVIPAPIRALNFEQESPRDTRARDDGPGRS